MEYTATAKYIRTSTRKIRLVVDAVKDLPIEKALLQLSFMDKRGGQTVKAVLDSAIANAKGNNIGITQLKIKSIDVMGGPAMKRWHAVSRGMAHAFKKRMTHIRVVLTDSDVKGIKSAKK